MRLKQTVVPTLALALALPMAAQMGIGPQVPTLSGVWHPVVGTGSAYDRADKNGKKSQIEITIVGQEDVNGKSAFWLEMGVADPRSGGQMYAKALMTVADNSVSSTKIVMQQPGQDPMEIDMAAMPNVPGGRMHQTMPSDVRDKAEVVGTESITVPAGTFTCQHYRMKDGSSDVWVSDKVFPWGLVKSQDKDSSSMVLTKLITDAKDHITGTPRKFDPMQIMRDRMGQQGQ